MKMHRISTNVTSDQKRVLESLCQACGYSMSTLLKVIINEYMMTLGSKHSNSNNKERSITHGNDNERI